QIRQRESQLKEAQADLGHTRIHAPIVRAVLDQLGDQVQAVIANQPARVVVEMADLSTVAVRAQVSEADTTLLEEGMPVWFTTLGQPDVRRERVLRQILPTPEVVNNVVLFNALFDVPSPDGKLLPQMSAQVFFVKASARNALSIPVSALQPAGRPAPGEARGTDADGKRYRVRVLVNGQPEERIVTVGVMTRVSAEVLDGLEEGDQVVIGGGRPAGGASAARPMQPRPRF